MAGRARRQVRFAGRVGLADLRRHARALETCGVDARLAGDAQHADGQHRRPGPRPLDVHRPRGQPRARARRPARRPARRRRSRARLGLRAARGGPARPRSSTSSRAAACRGRSIPPRPRSWPTRRSWSGPPGPAVCFPNEDEADVLGDGIADAYEVVVLKRGHEGVRVLRRGAPAVDVPAATVAAVDQTGAGDAFAAGYLAALVQGHGRPRVCAGGGPRRRRGGQPSRRAAAVGAASVSCLSAGWRGRDRRRRCAANCSSREGVRRWVGPGRGVRALFRAFRTASDGPRRGTCAAMRTLAASNVDTHSRRSAPRDARVAAAIPDEQLRGAATTPHGRRATRATRAGPAGCRRRRPGPGPTWAPMTGPISETNSGSLPKISRPLATRRSASSGAWMCWMTQPSAPSSWRERR